MNVVIWGAGQEGRGFLAPLFRAHSEITLVDCDEKLIALLNERGRYVLYQHPVGAPSYEEEITQYNAFVAGCEDSINRLTTADVVALCLYTKDFPKAVEVLAKGLHRRRWRNPEQNLDLLICANSVDLGPVLRDLFARLLDSDSLAWMDERVGLVETMARRSCVAGGAGDGNDDPLGVATNVFPTLLVNGGDAKIDYSGCPGIEIVHDMRMEERRKLYLYNLAHAVYAYLGAGKGYRFMLESLDDPGISATARRAIRQSGQALRLEYNLSDTEMDKYERTMERFVTGSRLPDTIARAGYDPVRKLSADERIIGPARMCARHGVDPEAIVTTAAAAFRFWAAGDPSVDVLRTDVQTLGIRNAVVKYCGLAAGSELTNRIVMEYEKMPEGG